MCVRAPLRVLFSCACACECFFPPELFIEEREKEGIKKKVEIEEDIIL